MDSPLQPRSICVLHPGPLREVLASVPALKWLTRQPHLDRILIITHRSGADLLRAAGVRFEPALLEDNDWAEPLQPWAIYRVVKLARWLKHQRFDLACDFHGTVRSKLSTLWLRAARTRSIDLRFARGTGSSIRSGLRKHPQHAIDRYLALAGAGAADSSAPTVRVEPPPEIVIKVESQLQDRTWSQGEVLIGVATARQIAQRRWSDPQFVDLIVRLVTVFNWRPIVFHPGRPRVEEKALGDARRHVWLRKPGPVLEDAALMSRCAGVLAEDSDAALLAEAVGTPVVLLGTTPGFELATPPYIDLSSGSYQTPSVEQVFHALNQIVHQGRSSTLFNS